MPPPVERAAGRGSKPVVVAIAALALLGALLVFFASPAGDRALGSVMDRSSFDRFMTNAGVLILTVTVVVVAFLVNKFAIQKRKNVRRMVIPLLLYIATLGASAVFPRVGLDVAGQSVRAVGELLGVITVINVVSIVVFDLFLPSIAVNVAPIVSDVSMGVAYVVAIIAGMRRSGVDVSGVIATSAVVTAILALSLQATLGNIVGGFALQIDNSIRVGDWIQLENGRQGRVTEIRWRHTVIETRDWDTLIVPNASLLAATILILGKREGQPIQHRMHVFFNVDFRYNPADVTAAVEQALRGAPIDGASSSPPPSCVCLDFAKDGKDSFAYYSARYWLTDLANDDRASSNVRTRIYSALQRANIPLAVPAAQLFVEQDDPERRERKRRREIDRRLAALRTVTFMKPLHEEELLKIAESLKYSPFAAGETITRQGAVAHWLYILTEGKAEVRIQFEGAGARVVATLSAPDFCGEMGLMTGEPRTATVVALTEVECYRLDKEVFHRILGDRPEIAEEISRLLAERRLLIAAALHDSEGGDRQTQLDIEQNRLLGTIRGFFGLGDSSMR